MSFTIEVDSAPVLEAFNRLIALGQDMNPAMRAIGEDVAARAKARFGTLTAPDGTPWAPNSDTTLRAALHRSGSFKQDGGLSKKGQRYLAGKRPLHGESGDLARDIHYAADGDGVTISASPVYAAIQQFGGKKAEFPHLWGDIPARPFLPVTADGRLYPDEEDEILGVLRAALENAVNG